MSREHASRHQFFLVVGISNENLSKVLICFTHYITCGLKRELSVRVFNVTSTFFILMFSPMTTLSECRS